MRARLRRPPTAFEKGLRGLGLLILRLTAFLVLFVAMIAWIAGSHSGVMGLPLFETRALLKAAGFPLG